MAAGSYNQAAEALGVTHQAVSKTMRRIDAQTLKPVFTRRQGKAVPTEFGREFLRDAALLCRSFSDFENTYIRKPSHQASEQELSVALVVGGNAGLPEGFFENYTRQHPSVTLVIEEMNSERVLEAVRSGEFDLGVLGTHPSLVEEFEAKAIVRMGVWVMVPAAHPLTKSPCDRAGMPHIPLEALDRLPMVTAGTTNHLPRYVMERCRQAGVRPNVVATSTDGEFMKRFVQERGAVCFAFDPRIRKPPEGNVAVRVDFPGSQEFGTYAIRQPDRRHSAAAEDFWHDELPLIGG